MTNGEEILNFCMNQKDIESLSLEDARVHKEYRQTHTCKWEEEITNFLNCKLK